MMKVKYLNLRGYHRNNNGDNYNDNNGCTIRFLLKNAFS